MKDMDLIRILVTPFLIIIGIAAVVYIFSRTMTMIPQSMEPEAMRAITGVAGTAIAMIGTLVGFTVGNIVGAAGREKADERTMDAMQDKMKAEKSIAVLWGMEPEVMERARQKRPDLF